MLDRNIRNTRSKEETKKAHRQAVLTAIILVAMFIVVTRVQDFIMTPFKNLGVPALGFILAICAGAAMVGAAAFLVYKHGKSQGLR